ncbi:tRNA (adenine(58)-N(1))-methyltransferase non-catalytic subunit TRM6 [Halocaridina rubra]|uniref:tRNA (adenine(58)-N(1))-methyltransferase non-catalytic subunit TRM6 n=1 Tax=Halocaridina rubra TaxID=373956 RepID=A0AAN9A277_HALRR
MPSKGCRILEDLNVIVQRGDYLKSCRVKAGRNYTFGKKGEGQFTINIDGAIGCVYGSSFKMERVANRLFHIKVLENNVASSGIVTAGGEDNRNLCDDGSSQKLTPEEISRLKSSGLTGKEVVQTITENSMTFKEKTVYSQEKYVNKKQKKYDEIITIHRPSIRLLSTMYYLQDPLKISNLRIDSLSQLLCLANVQSGGRFVVFESGTSGLVAAAMLHRMGSSGHLVYVYHGNHPHRDAIDLMNFTTSELEVLSFISYTKLCEQEGHSMLTNGMERPSTTDETGALSSTNEMVFDSEQPVEEDTSLNENSEVNEKESADCQKPTKSRIFVRKQADDVLVSSSILRDGVEGLIVACRLHPVNITVRLLQFLKPGHSFVVFSPYKEPLMELYFELKSLNCTNLRLSENWLRHYQVLPQRTHPEVNMSGGGGYLLYGIKISKET